MLFYLILDDQKVPNCVLYFLNLWSSDSGYTSLQCLLDLPRNLEQKQQKELFGENITPVIISTGSEAEIVSMPNLKPLTKIFHSGCLRREYI